MNINDIIKFVKQYTGVILIVLGFLGMFNLLGARFIGCLVLFVGIVLQYTASK